MIMFAKTKKMTNKFLVVVFALMATVFSVNAQLISSDPPFPSDENQVVITFDASLGNAGLAGYTGDIYAHTGVITENSSSETDWKYVKAGWSENIPECKLTNIGADLWQFTLGPSIREYYDVPAGELIEQMAFVFRSEDGSITGKTDTGGDIFYDVFVSGLNVKITLPGNSNIIVALNDVIDVEGNSSESDSTFLYNNNQLVYADTGSSFQYSLTVSQSGNNWFKAIARSGTEMVADSFSYYARPEIIIEDVPEGIIDGINYINDNTVILSLYAPEKEYVFAIGDFSDWQVGDEYYMKRSTDGKRYWIQLNDLQAGQEYIFQYFIDGQIRVGDPYADKVSDPWNDKWIPESNYPNLIEYPEGMTSGIATVFQTAQSEYEWQIDNFDAPSKDKLVIYELLIRDFTTGKTFDDVIDTLDYLAKLGINAIELMPVNEFEGNNSWGYNPNYYFAVDKYYGPKDTFKAFIDAAHEKGIAVLMDLVLNHAYGTCPLVLMYWDAENNRPAANNPWFNAVSPNEVYAWGNDFNHESQDTKDFIDRVNTYWMDEYKIDGYRFDFTKGFTNKPGDGWAFDQSRIDILKRMTDVIKNANSDAYVILEHLSVNTEEKVLANDGIMLWGNMNHNYNQSTMGYDDQSDFSGISYKERGFNDPNLVGYMESHDEERLMYKNLLWGNSSGTYDITNLNTALKRNEMAAAFFITVPGPKMIWQFGEMGYDYSINTCEDGSISDDCRLSPKPVKWNYFDNFNRRNLYYVYSALIDLKKNEDAMSSTDFSLSVSSEMKSIHINHEDMDVTIIGNFDVNEGNINPSFQESGKWYDYLSGDSIVVEGVNDEISLNAGEYHIYTSKRLTKPDYVGVNEIIYDKENKVNIFPNPASNNVNVFIDESISGISTVVLFDVQGRKIKEMKFIGNQIVIDIEDLNKGLYLLNVETNGFTYVNKILKN